MVKTEPAKNQKNEVTIQVESPKLDKFKALINRDHSNFVKFEQRMKKATSSKKR